MASSRDDNDLDLSAAIASLGEGDSDEEVGPDTEAPPPLTPKRGPGRPKGSKKGVGAPMEGTSPVSVTAAPTARAPTIEELLKAIREEPNKDPTVRWPLILTLLAAMGLTPQAVAIRVERFPVGPYGSFGSGMTLPNSISGDSVAGDEMTTPSDALTLALAEIHIGYNQGPARYRLTFYYKTPPPMAKSGTALATADITFDSSAAVAHSIQHAQRLRSVQQPAWSPAPPMGLGAQPSAFTPASTAQVHHAYYPPPPTGPDNALVQQLLAMLEPHLRAGQQSPVVVQPPPSVAPPPIQVKTGAESLAEQLQTMQLFAKMAETMGFVRPSYAAPAGVGVGAPAPAPQAIPIAPALDPLSGLIRDLKKVEEMKATLKTAFGFVDPRDEPDEPEEPAPKTPPEADVPYDTYTIPLTSQYNGGVDMKGIKPKPGKKMTIIDHVKGWAEQNPMATLTFGSKAFEIIDKSTMGAVVKAIGERGAVGLGAMPPVAPEPPVPTPPQISAAPPLATPPQHSMSNGVDRHVVQVPADLTSYVPPA